MNYVFEQCNVVSRWLRAGIILALIFGIAAAGRCVPGPKTSDLAAMSIEDLMNVTVVTAGKKAETISKTPAAVFVITHEDIEHYGYQTLGQALKRISGFYTEYDYLYDYVGLRGYLPNNDLNRRVLILVDGHKVNDYLYGQAPVNQDLPVDMRDLERIEVVKGPGSALWGSEALLCVINCITKGASQTNKYELRQDVGFRSGEHLAYGQSFPGGLEVTATAAELRSGGQQRIFFTEYNDPSTDNGISDGMDGENVGRGYVKMSYKGFKFFYDHVNRVKNLPTAAWGAVFNQPGLSINDERRMWELSYENPKPFAGNGQLFCRFYRDNYDVSNDFNWQDGNDVVKDKGIELARAHGAELRYSRDFSSRLSAILGAEYLRTNETKRVNYVYDPSYVLRSDRRGSFDMLSYYTQVEWDATDLLRFVGGTRYDDHSMFGGNWCPRMAAIYRASPKTTLKLLYGEAMRMPSISECRTGGNPYHLKPEKIITNELVWDQQVSNNGHIITSIYQNKLYGLIREDWNRIPGNRDSVDSGGIESQYEYRLRNGGSGYFGLALVKAFSKTADYPLPSSPHQLYTAGVSVPVLGDKAYLATEMHYVSQSRTNLANRAPAYAVANLTLTSNSLIRNTDISLGITNLFNTPYRVNARPEHYQDVIPQPDRAVQFQVSHNM